MSRHLEKVLAHAEADLATAGRGSSTDLLALYRKFLKIEEHRLQMRHRAGDGGREIARKRVDLLDIILQHLFQAALEEAGISKKEPRLAIIAIGGYGRGELNPCSDVDVMFLHAGANKPAKAEAVAIEKILYLLWDVGFKVGYSVRSVAEAIRQANEDLMSKTALLESRLLTGEPGLYEQFHERFLKQCVRGKEREYIHWRIRNQAERHEKQANTVYLQEPNIKTGCGGLRDYQNLLWVAFFAERVRTTAEMVALKLMSEPERRMLERAYDFLLRIRTELHYLTNRSTDILTLYFQGQIANRMQYPQKNILRRSEAFMKDYYGHARNIFLTCQTVSDRMALPRVERKTAAAVALHFLARRPKQLEEFDGFCAENGMIHPAGRDIFRAQPQRMIRVFQHAQQRGLALSPELQQMIRRRLDLVNRTFQYSRAARETFEAILSRKGQVGRTLRLMHEVDFLGSYLPEFGRLTCLVQHEFYHRYTADEHTLVCVEKLDGVIDTEDAKIADYRLLFQKLEDPYILYLALLLHDTGKASNSRHHEDASALNAQRVSRRLQIGPERRKQLIHLVDHHTTLSITAQRRDLDDPETVRQFAEIVHNQSNLDALMLLTLADGMGTGDEGWSDWKESLVWRLYRSTSRYLADGEAYTAEDNEIRLRLKAEAQARLPSDFGQEIDAHFQYMPDRYYRMFDGHEVRRHLRMFRTFLESSYREKKGGMAKALRWIDHDDRGHTELLVCTWDQRQLLARLAGVLALAELNILSADVFTRGDNLVLDIFRVCDTRLHPVSSERDRRLVERLLNESLLTSNDLIAEKLQAREKDGTFYLAPEVEFPTRITVTNELHPLYTLIEVVTPDRLGLLHDLLSDLSDFDITIQLSRITTEKGAAIDNFYVTDTHGQKVAETLLPDLQERLTKSATGVTIKAA